MKIVEVTTEEEQVEQISYSMRIIDDKYDRFKMHPVKIHHEVVTSATTSAVLYVDLLQQFLTTISTLPLGDKIKNFMMLDAKFGVRIVIQGQPFAAGKIVYSFAPEVRMITSAVSTVTTHVRTRLNDVNCMVVPHMDIDPGASESYDIVLPNVSPYGKYPLKTPFVGSYCLTRNVISPLISGTAVSPSMSVCIYMWLINPSLEGMTLLSGELGQEKKSGGLLSNVARGISKASGFLAPVFPSFGPGLTLFSQVAATAGDVLSFFGFSKPQVLENTHMVLNRTQDNWSQVDGRSTALVLGDTQAVKLGIDPRIGVGHPDEMLVANICKIPGLVSTDSITSADASGTLFNTLFITPSLTRNNEVTPLGGIQACFYYWTGDMNVDVEIIASIFHRCTILVAWDPSAVAAVPTLEQAVQTLETTTISITGRSKTRIKIPWRQPIIFKDVFLNSPPGNAVSNGRLYFYVVNVLTSNGSTDPIYINTYYSSDNIYFHGASPLWFENRVVSMELLSAEIDFGSSSDLKKIPLITGGRSLSSVKEIAAKMDMCYTQNFAIGPGTIDDLVGVTMPNFPVVLNNQSTFAGSPTVSNSYLDWISSAYLGYRGGIRYSYYLRSKPTPTYPLTTTADFVFDYFNYAKVGVNIGIASGVNTWHDVYDMEILSERANGLTIQNRSINKCCDFVAPYMSSSLYVPTVQCVGSSTNAVTMAGTPPFSTTATYAYQEMVLKGAADDASFLFFVGFPKLVP